MATVIRNIETGATVTFSNGRGFDNEGHALLRGSLNVSAKWMLKNHVVANLGKNDDGNHVLQLAEGWEVVTDKPRKQRKPKDEPKDEPKDDTKDAPKDDTKDAPKDDAPKAEEPKEEPKAKVVTKIEKIEIDYDALFGPMAAMFKPLVEIILKQCNSRIQEMMEQVEKDIAKKCARTEIKIGDAKRIVKGKLHKKFNAVLQRLCKGKNVFLWGKAGTGKSYLAKQVAEALGLPFYAETTLQDAFDLKGFKDAGGRYQETQFYIAVKNGGVFLLDEADASAAEIFVVVNTLLANGYFTFPNGERLEAHKDFHFICAGNTCGLGATEEYNGRFKMDESTRDRFSFIKLDVDPEIELEVQAGGDKEIVDFAHAVRDAAKRANRLKIDCSTRAIESIADAKSYEGETDEEILESEFLKGRSIDQIKTLVNNMTLPKTNRWMKALYNIAYGC